MRTRLRLSRKRTDRGTNREMEGEGEKRGEKSKKETEKGTETDLSGKFNAMFDGWVGFEGFTLDFVEEVRTAT